MKISENKPSQTDVYEFSVLGSTFIFHLWVIFVVRNNANNADEDL
jgi:hypothetical protein